MSRKYHYFNSSLYAILIVQTINFRFSFIKVTFKLQVSIQIYKLGMYSPINLSAHFILKYINKINYSLKGKPFSLNFFA